MTITRNFRLGLNKGFGVSTVIHVNQYDHDETWVFTLVDETGAVYTPTTGGIVGIKADGNVIANTGTVNSSGQVVITETEQMTAVAGDAIFELIIDGATHGTANFIARTEPKPGDNGTYSESDLSLLQEAIDSTNPTNLRNAVQDWMDDNLAPSQWVIDNTLSIAGAAADAKKTGYGLSELKTEINTQILPELKNKNTLAENQSADANGYLFVTIKEGNFYSVNVQTTGATQAQVHVVGGGQIVQTLTPVISGNINTTLEFTAVGNANSIYVYKEPSSATAVLSVYEYDSKNLAEQVEQNTENINAVYSRGAVYSQLNDGTGTPGVACYKIATIANRGNITEVKYKGSSGSTPNLYIVKNNVLTDIIELYENDGSNYITYDENIPVEGGSDVFIGGATGSVFFKTGGTDPLTEFAPAPLHVGDSVTYTVTPSAHLLFNCELSVETSSYDASLTIVSNILHQYPRELIVSIIDDDTNYYAPQIWNAILQGYNDVKIGFACLTGYMNGTYTNPDVYRQMTLEQLKTFYNNGHEVYSHGWAGYSVRPLTDAELSSECWKSKDWLFANGFCRGAETLVYSGGENNNSDHFNVVRGFYKFGVNAWGGGINADILKNEPLYINRLIGDTSTLAALTALVDSALSAGGILVIGFHSYELMQDEAANVQKVRDLISYIKGKNIPIIPLEQAIHSVYGLNV